MLKVTIPFTNEVVFNPLHYSENQIDEVIVNRFDEVRGEIQISVKSFHVEDIAVYIIQLKSPESVLISARVEQPAWMMNFTLQGQLSIRGVNTSMGLRLNADTHNSLIQVGNTTMDAVIQGEVTLFTVCLSQQVVKKLLTCDENAALQNKLTEGAKIASNRVITRAMHDILNSITDCAENNCLHRIFLAAKMLELLFLDIEQLNQGKEATPRVLKTHDLEKLQLAKKLIGQDLQSPCSLVELAHKVGLNDFKLKKGFREAFGTTVFGHLYDLRMEKAREMLSASEYTVSEVAHLVGYKNAHHFTAAFKKKFGYLPSNARKA
ncbi:helix-turn-helix transcriptional regulator [Mucilaginibacter auburnensis]|uniref:AraC-like DNA-binding protein n=1 Tax=Mucilaginibacter auburnensis TaxID=1457233 RepID=A0A2H9VW16_9SPHI|nr:AraC family transcriptional regulator [Mucilaginibacter auburnensis]PJJ85018.1 AraC-like DNA-binding protein [Mucilaginibacter auburnensis]